MAQARPQQSFWFNPGGGGSTQNEDLELASILLPYGSEEKSIASQLERAKALRDTAAPTGLNPTGRVFTKANPMEFMAAGMKRYIGERDVPDAFARQKTMGEKIAEEFRKKLKEREDRSQAQKFEQQAQRGEYGPPEPAGFPMPPSSQPYAAASSSMFDDDWMNDTGVGA